MTKYWFGKVTKESNALDLEENVFTFKDPKKIAKSLRNSAETSKRKRSSPFRSAMSMLNFYINRAGKSLSPSQRKRLERAKDELRKLYHRRRSHAGKTHRRARKAKSARR